MNRIALIAILSLVQTGCASVGSIWGPAPEQAAQQAANYDDAKCRSYGATPGTPAYIGCRTQLDSQRAEDDSRRRAAIATYLLNNR